MPRNNQFNVILSFVLFYTLCCNTYGVEQLKKEKIWGNDTAANDYLGISVDIDENTIVAGAQGDDNSTGAAYVFVKNGGQWIQQAKLQANDAAENELFGRKVAISGDTIIVGTRGDQSGYGAAYIFVRNGETWTQQAKLSDGVLNSHYGVSVAVDGDTAVVGAANVGGSVYVYTRSGTTWTLQQNFSAGDTASNDYFGGAVAIEGDTLFIGNRYGDALNYDTGEFYIFTRNGGVWSQSQKFYPSQPKVSSFMGTNLDLEGDWAIVGAECSSGYYNYPGYAYIYKKNSGSWSEHQIITASDSAVSDLFGRDVAISDEKILVGASYTVNYCSSYLFKFNMTSWSEDQKIYETTYNDKYGYSVAIDKNTAVVGAYWDSEMASRTGAVYVYEQIIQLDTPNGGETWQAGTVHDIVYSVTETIPAVDLHFSSDNGTSWEPINLNVPNTGAYAWLVPDVSSSECLVKVSDASDGELFDVSDDTFSIVSQDQNLLKGDWILASTSGPPAMDSPALEYYQQNYVKYFPAPVEDDPIFTPAGDVNWDQTIATVDASLILQQYALLIDYFPADTNEDDWGPDYVPGGKLARRERSGYVVDRELSASVIAGPDGKSWVVRFAVDDASGLCGVKLGVWCCVFLTDGLLRGENLLKQSCFNWQSILVLICKFVKKR